MNRNTFDAMIEREIAQVVDTHLPHGQGTITAVRLRTALQTIAGRTETAARAYYLGNLRTVDDIAAQFGVSRRRAQAIAKMQHDRWGKGMRIGNAYIFSDDEIESMRPADSAGRPATTKPQPPAPREVQVWRDPADGAHYLVIWRGGMVAAAGPMTLAQATAAQANPPAVWDADLTDVLELRWDRGEMERVDKQEEQ